MRIRDLLFPVLLLSFLSSIAQDLESGSGIYPGEENITNCLTPESDFRELLSNNSEEREIHLQLRNKQVIDELTLRDSAEVDIKLWILYNNSFKNKDSLIVTTGAVEETYCLAGLDPVPKSRGAAVSNKGYVQLPVFFATDRNYNKNSGANEMFGTQRSIVRYGVCNISIPNNHKAGEIEEPVLWKLEFEEDPKEHIMIHSTRLLDKKGFVKSLNEELGNAAKNTSLLFVHGYNVSFDEAAKRTAQISYDLLFEGVPVFYSWPSRASLTGYTNDEANIEWSKSNLKKFLKLYLKEAKAKEVYLIAHSMGNRGLTGALVELLTENPELKGKIKEVILAAPDIDADIFKRDLAPKMAKLTNNPVTLYVSANDVALKASKLVHGYSRAGDVNDGLILVEGFETVDATGIDTSFLGHSYFAESDSLISDIFNLIKTGRRAEKRNNLKEFTRNLATYWRIKSN